jgi:membrane protease YdiL (CAAX protease family)
LETQLLDTILDPANRLFNMARQGRRLPSALTAIAVVFAVLVLALIPGQMLGRAIVRLFPSGDRPIAEPIIQNATMFLPIYLGLWVWLQLVSKRPFRTLGLEPQHARQYALRGALMAGLMMAATAGLSIVRGATFAPGLLQTMGLTALGIRLVSLVTYFVQGPAEEVLFRGWLLPVIGARYRPWIGVLVSSLIFSLAHAGTHGITLLGFLNLFLFGVFAAVYALAEGGVWGPGAWHAVWNWAMGDLLGFATDGTPHTGLLSSVRADGPEIISGGAFGLEGGLACTAVFLIAIAVIVVRTHLPGSGGFRHWFISARRRDSVERGRSTAAG